jgi:hypothetical protein
MVVSSVVMLPWGEERELLLGTAERMSCADADLPFEREYRGAAPIVVRKYGLPGRSAGHRPDSTGGIAIREEREGDRSERCHRGTPVVAVQAKADPISIETPLLQISLRGLPAEQPEEVRQQESADRQKLPPDTDLERSLPDSVGGRDREQPIDRGLERRHDLGFDTIDVLCDNSHGGRRW